MSNRKRTRVSVERANAETAAVATPEIPGGYPDLTASQLDRSSRWWGSGIWIVAWVFGRFGVFGSCLRSEDWGVFDEFERFGLEGGWLGEFLEGGGVAVQAGGVAGLGRELGQERAVAVRGLPGAGLLGLRFARGGGGADCFCDGVGADGPLFVGEQQGFPRGFEVPGEVVGEGADEHVRADAVLEVVMDRADLQVGAFQ